MAVGNGVGNGKFKTLKKGSKIHLALDIIFGSPSGVRTRVTGVRGRRPRPLDDGTNCQILFGV